MILILTAADDVHADAVHKLLQQRGADVLRVDPGAVPATGALSCRYGDGATSTWLLVAGQRHRLDEARSAWYRRPSYPSGDRALDRDSRVYAERESYQTLQELWSSLPLRWLPGPLDAIRHADGKHLQLRLAEQLGFTIPPTLVTNDPQELIAFYRRHDGQILDKQPSVLLARERGAEVMRYAQMVSTRDIAYANRVRYSPMLFQAYVPKRVELRVTVVGQRVFAAEIHSQATAHTRHDWRRYDHGHTPHAVHQLPAAESERCLGLVERLGLRYGAIDLIQRPDGQYVFLEINPNGQWLWIEERTGLPICAAVADELMT